MIPWKHIGLSKADDPKTRGLNPANGTGTQYLAILKLYGIFLLESAYEISKI
jgi:hypothetical protein